MRASLFPSAFGALLRPSLVTPTLLRSHFPAAAAAAAAAAIPIPPPPPLTTTSRPTPPTKRWSSSKKTRVVPSPTPFVPDVDTFLKLIGRKLRRHASKFPSWEALFTLTSDQLRELGVEPPRTRRYLLRWRQRFVEGRYGPGGDLAHVREGRALLRVKDVGTVTAPRRVVVNVPEGVDPADVPLERAVRPAGYTVDEAGKNVQGPYVRGVRAGVAYVLAQSKMWMEKRGRKIDGGERRRDEVRFKRRVAERKALREKMGAY